MEFYPVTNPLKSELFLFHNINKDRQSYQNCKVATLWVLYLHGLFSSSLFQMFMHQIKYKKIHNI